MKHTILIFFLFTQLWTQKLIVSDSLLTDKPLKNPTKAILWSMALPGAGQIYNEDYWKTALLTPSFIYFVYRAIDQNQLKNSLTDQIASTESELSLLQATDPTSEAISGLTSRLSSEKSDLADAKEERSLAIWRSALVYLINVLDAYISAYLFGFDELMDHQTERKFRMNSKVEQNQYKLEFQFNF